MTWTARWSSGDYREQIARIFDVDHETLCIPLVYVQLGCVDTSNPVVERNPEQDVIDEIDELVNQQLRSGNRSSTRYDRCPVCLDDWHGLPSEYGCPGESQDSRGGFNVTYAELDGVPVDPHTLQPFSDDVRSYDWGGDI